MSPRVPVKLGVVLLKPLALEPVLCCYTCEAGQSVLPSLGANIRAQVHGATF